MDEQIVEIAARALVMSCSDSTEDFEISWHTKGVKETEMKCARAVISALEREGYHVVKLAEGRHPVAVESDDIRRKGE